MEEGPEPQELMENVEHNLHAKSGEGGEAGHAHHSGGGHARAAMVAAGLAVGASISSLLSGHAANEAMVKLTQASDRWSYYQAKSTKAHMYEVNQTLLSSLGEVFASTDSADATKIRKAKLAATLANLKDQAATYENEKVTIQKEAQTFEEESTALFKKHEIFSFSVACFQIGIVLASLSIIMTSGALSSTSIVAGVVATMLCLYGWIIH